MTVYVRFATEIAAPPELVFNLAVSIDAHAASMSMHRWCGRAVGGRTRGQIGPGEQVAWRARHAGITWRLTSQITDNDRPVRFVDEQVRGPFASYRHVHDFVPSDGGTLMLDESTFAAPLSYVGRLAERGFLRRRVRSLSEARNDHLRALAEHGLRADLP